MNTISLKFLLIAMIVPMIIITSCQKDPDDNNNGNPEPKTFNDLKIPHGFNFETGTNADITVWVKNNQDIPLVNVRVNILTGYREDGGKLLASGVTDQNGVFSRIHPIPAYYTSLVVATDYLGLPSEVEVPLANGKLAFTLGGSQQPSLKSGAIPFKSTSAVFHPMGPYNSQGVPLYLEPVNDVIDTQFLDDINASFPERQPVPIHNPHYLDPNNEYDFKLLEASDVWVTFVHEGAGYKNVFGYYTYTIGSPPATPAAIDTIKIIFPNVSFQGSGGGLISGNKVYLGQFAPNTALGWVLIADGFVGGNITTGRGVYYSNPVLNPESDPNKRQHAVHLFDNGRDLFLLGFEDLNRMGHSDDDFNDAMFYITANPIQAVDLTNFQTITYTSDDSDGDGISDQFDDYPNDPLRAFDNYYPSEDGFGTLAFEDLWPGKGDFDFNDMVIDYNINQITNGNNQVVEIQASFTLRAMGASFRNGFGFQLPLAPANIATVSGQQLSPQSIINLNANGTEAGQSNAVIIVFDDGYKVLPASGGGTGVNTNPSMPVVAPVTVNLSIMLTTPMPLSQVGLPPYNPFIFTNQRRGYEIHLPDRPPTDLADVSLFGTSHDNTIPGQNRWYKTSDNLPWAIHVMESFDYPKEKVDITSGYLKMGAWAESAGTVYIDWFKPMPGYRDTSKIFSAGF